MKVELTKEWCMNMATIEERADDAATMCVWCEERVQGACKSQYDTLTCTHRVFVPTAEQWDAAVESRAAERNEGKSNAAHWHQRATEAEAEVAQARQTTEYWKAEHLAGNARIGELHDELAATALRSADHLRRAIKAEAKCEVLEMNLEAARRELAKVNNEFGSENADWPEAWRRVAEVKERAGRLWRDNETLRAALTVVVRDWTEQFERNGHLAPAWVRQAREALGPNLSIRQP